MINLFDFNVSFLYSLKRSETSGILPFSGGTEEHRSNMGQMAY